MKIQSQIDEDGKISCELVMQNGDDPIKVGVQLASATRMIAKSLRDALKLPDHHDEKIEAIIVETYVRDMTECGPLGEKVKRVDEDNSTSPI